METYFPHLASPAAPSKKAKQTVRHLLPVAGLLLSGRVPFAAILLVVLVFVVIALDPATVLFTGFLIYALSGPVRALFRGKPRKASGAAD